MFTAEYLLIPVGILSGGSENGSYLLQANSRKLVQSEDEKQPDESGRFDYALEIKDPAKIRSWQAVDGGVYYVSGDDKLHWLKANSQSATTQPAATAEKAP